MSRRLDSLGKPVGMSCTRPLCTSAHVLVTLYRYTLDRNTRYVCVGADEVEVREDAVFLDSGLWTLGSWILESGFAVR